MKNLKTKIQGTNNVVICNPANPNSNHQSPLEKNCLCADFPQFNLFGSGKETDNAKNYILSIALINFWTFKLIFREWERRSFLADTVQNKQANTPLAS